MSDKNSGPWWKYGHVWLVISGPVAVILAAFATLYFVVSRPDPVVDENYYRKGMEINKTLGGSSASHAPAQLARNHAQTGVIPPAKGSDAASKP